MTRKGYDGGGVRTIEDLKNRCSVDELTGCWIWRLSVSLGAPHVTVCLGDKKHSMRGRRAALVLVGQKIPPGHQAVARSFCTHAMCVHPDHTRSASTKEAWKLKVASGSLKNLPSKVAAARAQGVKLRKLTDEMVSDIRHSEASVAELAKRHNVSGNAVRNVLRGKTYRPAGYSIFSQVAA